jgi:hypothetical protein
MHGRVNHGGKPEARHQLVERIDEPTIGVKNKLGCMQRQYSVAQQLAAHMQSDGGYFENVL